MCIELKLKTLLKNYVLLFYNTIQYYNIFNITIFQYYNITTIFSLHFRDLELYLLKQSKKFLIMKK